MKCAGSSIEHALYTQSGEDALCAGSTLDQFVEYEPRNNNFIENGHPALRFHKHTWPSLFRERIGDLSFYDNYKRITMVRNPWDALVSYYWWAMRFQNESQPILIREDDSPDDVKGKFEYYIFEFYRHQSEILAYELNNGEALTCSAWKMFSGINKKFLDPCIDYYIRFESLKEDYSKVCEDLNIKTVDIPRHKSGIRKVKKHYSEYYNDETRSIVYKGFYDIIDYFGYEFTPTILRE